MILGTASVAIVRKYLDSGVLSKIVEQTMANLSSDRNGSTFLLTILAACAMSLGSKLSTELKDFLEENPSSAVPLRAKWQMKKALGEYSSGTPYNFGNRTMYEAQFVLIRGDAFRIETINNGWQKLIKRFKNEKDEKGSIDQILGPPGPADLGEKEVHIFELCGQCGKDKAEAGAALVVCGNCKHRRYCSKACQKKHWKQHKMVCNMVTSQLKEDMMATFREASSAEIEDIQAPKGGAHVRSQGISMMLA